MIEHRVERENKLTVYTAHGKLAAEEIRSAVNAFYAENPTLKVLCDVTRASLADLATNEIEDIIDFIYSRWKSRAGGRTAIVAQDSVSFGLARMFGTFAEIAELPVEFKTFRTMTVARTWLDELDTLPGTRHQDAEAGCAISL